MAALQLEADKQPACFTEAVHEVAGAEPQTEIAWMGRFGAEVVVRALDPEPIGEVSPQRHLDSVAVEAASEIVDLVLFEGRKIAPA